MRKLVKEISQGKNPQTNLSRYAQRLMGWYHEYAYVRLAMNYYGLYEIRAEEDAEYEIPIGGHDVVGAYLEKFHGIIGNLLAKGENVQEKSAAGMEKVQALRGSIIEKMEVLTAYTDIFNLYEHVLNRVEYRFKDGELPEGYSDEDFCRKLMKYIVRDEESAVINSKIGEIIGELPVRLTKQKFFELLDTGISVYLGTDRQGLNDFLYRIRTSAGLDVPQTDLSGFEDLALAYDEFKKCDFANITKEDYENLSKMIVRLSEYLSEMANQYMLLMEQLNDAYIIFSSEPYAFLDAKEISACTKILENVRSAFTTDEKSLDEANDMLIFLEGVQEELYEKISAYAYIVDDVCSGQKENLIKYQLVDCYKRLTDMASLTSGSIFINLEKEADGELPVDEVYLAEKKAILYKDLETFFKANCRMVNRSVMTTMIAGLPVFFQNLTQLQDFIYTSLEQCRDKAEKIACVEVLNGITE
ncbi:MAG: hypothetical protein E7269_07950 [Lachnospiraceae bacterium]|nr:hypothetical protein [Lachnospiraceae bacterium]